MNATLDELARTIFRSWFVDFDPVHAKMEGREPFGMDAATAALFSDRLVDSPPGPIPEGWEVASLDGLYLLGTGGVWGTDFENDSDTFPVDVLRGIDLAALSGRQEPELATRFIKPSQYDKRQLRGGEILIEGSGSFCGRSVLFDTSLEQLANHPLQYSNFCKRLDPVVDTELGPIIWNHLREAYDDGSLASYRTGSAFPNFDVRSLLASFRVSVPPLSVAQVYGQLWSTFSGVHLMLESRTLAELRDTLLPELISGRIRVPGADKLVAEVV